jgi:hypothetical protein
VGGGRVRHYPHRQNRPRRRSGIPVASPPTLGAVSEHQAEAIARDLFETGQYREFDADNGREIIDLVVIREDAA